MQTEATNCSLTDLMSALLAFDQPTPCFLFTRTVEPMNKFARTRDGNGEKIPNPCLDCNRSNDKGEPFCLLAKFTRQMVRINDSYESAVIRRQLLEAAQRGEEVKAEDLFIADKATWGSKVDPNTPALFEWWIPLYTRDIQFYMAYRPFQHNETWFEPVEPCTIDGVTYEPHTRLPDDVVKSLRAEYMKERDDDMMALRQDVDRPVLWRKVRFDNILAMSVGGNKYVVTDHTMPEVPLGQRQRLMKMLADRDAQAEMKARAKAQTTAYGVKEKKEKAKKEKV